MELPERIKIILLLLQEVMSDKEDLRNAAQAGCRGKFTEEKWIHVGENKEKLL